VFVCVVTNIFEGFYTYKRSSDHISLPD